MQDIIKQIKKLQEEHDELYYRWTSKNDDMQGYSTEEDLDREELALVLGIEENEIDDWADEHNMHYDDERQKLLWNGVCCKSELEDLAQYVLSLGASAVDDMEVVVFAGRYVDFCWDGDVVKPTEVFMRVPAEILVEVIK